MGIPRLIEIKREKISPELQEYILIRDKYTCRYCGSKAPPFNLDHVYPVSKGGETSEDNLVTSCAKCNQKKHNRVGIFPKPIGYFEEKPNIQILNALLTTFGLGCVASGFMFISDYMWYGKTWIFIGIVLLSISVIRLGTGRNNP